VRKGLKKHSLGKKIVAAAPGHRRENKSQTAMERQISHAEVDGVDDPRRLAKGLPHFRRVRLGKNHDGVGSIARLLSSLRKMTHKRQITKHNHQLYQISGGLSR